MSRTTVNELLDAGVHFGHLRRKWNPRMAPYIFMERNGIHIIDLHKTLVKLDEAAEAMKLIAKSGRKILFVATKKQAKDLVKEKVLTINMPFVTERWPGGMLTNFPTIRKTIKKMSSIDKLIQDGSLENMGKRERLQVSRQRAKLDKNFGSIADMSRLPSAIFVVDILKEHIAVSEARILNIPIFAMVDTNSDPNQVNFPIPSNDDASKSIALIMDVLVKAIEEGLNERKADKEKDSKENTKDNSTHGEENERKVTKAKAKAEAHGDAAASKEKEESSRKRIKKSEE